VKRLLLVGGGQAHVFVLKALAKRRPPDVEVVLVTPSEHLIYSGMLPGWIAGHYQLPELTLPLAPLAAAAGVHLVTTRVIGVDLAAKFVQTPLGTLDFDLLSIASGATLDFDAIPGSGDHALPLRPLENFVAGWNRIYMHVLAATEPVRLTIIGGGAGGAEIALAIMYRLRTVEDAVHLHIVTGTSRCCRATGDGHAHWSRTRCCTTACASSPPTRCRSSPGPSCPKTAARWRATGRC
jgi:NADH dehydrogenase FAD-containing subunit